MKFHVLAAVLVSVCVFSCGPKPKPIPDAGDEDAGADAGVDAGRVRGIDPSNGWTQVVAEPATAALTTNIGVEVSSAPDQFGQPLIAAIMRDPNGDGNEQDNRVIFTRWNGDVKPDGGTGGYFEEMKTIEVVGEVDMGNGTRQVSIARDAKTGRIAIAYVKGADAIRYAWSDDEGANFSLKTLNNHGSTKVMNPVLVFTSQGFLVASQQLNSSNSYDIVGEMTGGASFTVQSVTSAPFALAVDESGAPGIAWVQYTTGTSGGLTLKFLRPWATVPASVAIANSGAFDALMDSTSLPSVSMTFVGTTPRVAYHLRNAAPVAIDDQSIELWYSAATDATGSSWSTPVGIVRNGGSVGGTVKYNSTRYYQGITVTSAGTISIASNYAAVGTPGAQCRGPKWATSTDGTTFNNCSVPSTSIDFGGAWLSQWLHTPTKNTLVFYYPERANSVIKGGIVMWRQP